ncbi:MAG: YfhO family protein, partial [Chloroflexota bacterium]
LVEISNADARDLITCFDARWADLVGITDVTINAPGISPRLCNVAGMKSGNLKLLSAVATQSWLLPEGTNWNPSPHFTVTYLYHNPDALPRTFLLPLAAARVVPGTDAQLQTVLGPHFDGHKELLLDPRTSKPPLGLGFLQDAWADWLRPHAVPMPSNLQPSEARVVVDTSNSVQVVFNAAAPGYLVLNDAYYPGWQAWLDGKPAPIRRADYLMRAVQVPAGTHRLVFTYAPVSYLAGLVISALSVLAIVAVLLWSWKPWAVRQRASERARPVPTEAPLVPVDEGLATLIE